MKHSLRVTSFVLCGSLVAATAPVQGRNISYFNAESGGKHLAHGGSTEMAP